MRFKNAVRTDIYNFGGCLIRVKIADGYGVDTFVGVSFAILAGLLKRVSSVSPSAPALRISFLISMLRYLDFARSR